MIQTVPIITPKRTRRGMTYGGEDTGVVAHIERNKSIRIVGMRNGKSFDRTFRVGETAEYDSYNLHYLGVIEKITDKGVTIKPEYSSRRVKRLTLDEFMWRNYDFDIDVIAKRNHETSMYI